MHGHHAHFEQNDHNHHVDAKLDADCNASAIRCCMMPHCSPAISGEPGDLPVFVVDDGATGASVVRGAGSDPGIVLPPPRRLPV